MSDHEMYRQVAGMTRDSEAVELAKAQGLNILHITWEDTGRFKGSVVGPNITDLTIQTAGHCMPVIRHPNFADKSCDLSPEKFFLLVGNEKANHKLEKVNLREFLAKIEDHMSFPRMDKIRGSLLADRDVQVLVSAQACFLPIPASGKATFNPVAFNYQSTKENPAVLTILATREGTSVTVIDNVRDKADAAWGQRLFFNKAGKKCPFEAERLKDFKAREEKELGFSVTPDKGLDMVLLIQVPLKVKPKARGGYMGMGAVMDSMTLNCSYVPEISRGLSKGITRGVDVEQAVLGHGAEQGDFVELGESDIERDTQFPIRVTVQFYKATSNGAVNAEIMKEIGDQINRVYADSSFVGSLVVDGETTRVTEHGHPVRTQPPGWWADFWARHQQNTGETPEATERKLTELFGDTWRNFSADEVERVRLSGRLG